MYKTFFLLAFFFMASWQPVFTGSPRNETEKPEMWQQEMLGLVNQIRMKGCRCGSKNMPPAPPLQWDASLENAAFNHAGDMLSHKFVGHKGSNGSRVGDRVSKTKYRWQTVGENVAWGDVLNTQRVVEEWKASPGHCMNLMNKKFKDFGAAKQGAFWVQVFGVKRN